MSTKRRDIQVDCILDLEAEEFDTFVMAGFYDVACKRYDDFWWHTNEEELARFLLFQFDGTCWAHFGGGYDYKWLLDWAKKLRAKVSIVVSGAGVVVIKTKHGIFADSFRLAPMSLARFSDGMGVAKQALKLPCLKTRLCKRDCPGFCQIRRNAPAEVLEKVKEYNRYDCLSLTASLDALRKFAEEHDLDLGYTIGGSSWRELQRLYGIKSNALPKYEHRFIRASYFGGRVQAPDHRRLTKVNQYDVNNMYGSRLAYFTVPAGEPRWFYGNLALQKMTDTEHCVCEATVGVPPMYFPPLPVRYKTKSGAVGVGFPTGTFSGVWTGLELRNAMRHGALVSVHRALAWPSAANPFREPMEKWWKLRTNAPGGKKSGLGEFMKFRQNSPTGKMGSKEIKQRYDLFIDDIRVCRCRTEEEKEACQCFPHSMVSEGVYSREYESIDPCARIEFATTLTSRARIELDCFAEEAGYENVVYCDTDGLKTLTEVNSSRIGSGLGQWIDEGPAYDFQALAPKVYSYLPGVLCGNTVILNELQPIIKSKGGQLDERPEDGSKSIKYGIRGIHSGAVTGQFFKRVTITRTFNRRYGDRVPLSDGRTRPMDASEMKIVDPLSYVKL